MKTRELIAKLQEADPGGDLEVVAGGCGGCYHNIDGVERLTNEPHGVYYGPQDFPLVRITAETD